MTDAQRAVVEKLEAAGWERGESVCVGHDTLLAVRRGTSGVDAVYVDEFGSLFSWSGTARRMFPYGLSDCL